MSSGSFKNVTDKLFVYKSYKFNICINRIQRSVMVIVVGNGHGDTSSNPGRD